MPTWEQMSSVGIEVAYMNGWRMAVEYGEKPTRGEDGPYQDGLRRGTRDRAAAKEQAASWMNPERTTD
jgi:hypothetical protein